MIPLGIHEKNQSSIVLVFFMIFILVTSEGWWKDAQKNYFGYKVLIFDLYGTNTIRSAW